MTGREEIVSFGEQRVPVLTWRDNTMIYAAQTAVNSLIYPLSVVRVLIQCGYEPVAPQRSTSLLGQPVLVLPSILGYARQLTRQSGLKTLFIGYVPKSLAVFTDSVVRDAVRKLLFDHVVGQPLSHPNTAELDRIRRKTSWPALFVDVLKRIFVEVVAGGAAIAVAYPFQLLSTRMVAQYVGRESKYNGTISGLRCIIQEEGLAGLYGGLIPAMLGEAIHVTCVVIGSQAISWTLSWLERAPEEEETLQRSTEEQLDEELQMAREREETLGVQLADILVSPLYYPFLLVSTRVMVSGCGLAAGEPGRIDNWWRYLLAVHRYGGWSTQGLMQGSGLLRRYLPLPATK